MDLSTRVQLKGKWYCLLHLFILYNCQYYFVNHCILNELLTLATGDIIHIKPILLKSGYSSILCFKTTLNSSKFLVLILALFLCAHHINMPSAETRIKVALKESLLYLMCG